MKANAYKLKTAVLNLKGLKIRNTISLTYSLHGMKSKPMRKKNNFWQNTTNFRYNLKINF